MSPSVGEGKFTKTKLKAAYEGKDIPQEFDFVTQMLERSSPQLTFEYRQTALSYGIQKLEALIERLQLALPESQDVAGIKSLHPEIYARCRTLTAVMAKRSKRALRLFEIGSVL